MLHGLTNNAPAAITTDNTRPLDTLAGTIDLQHLTLNQGIRYAKIDEQDNSARLPSVRYIDLVQLQSTYGRFIEVRFDASGEPLFTSAPTSSSITTQANALQRRDEATYSNHSYPFNNRVADIKDNNDAGNNPSSEFDNLAINDLAGIKETAISLPDTQDPSCLEKTFAYFESLDPSTVILVDEYGDGDYDAIELKYYQAGHLYTLVMDLKEAPHYLSATCPIHRFLCDNLEALKLEATEHTTMHATIDDANGSESANRAQPLARILSLCEALAQHHTMASYESHDGRTVQLSLKDFMAYDQNTLLVPQMVRSVLSQLSESDRATLDQQLFQNGQLIQPEIESALVACLLVGGLRDATGSMVKHFQAALHTLDLASLSTEEKSQLEDLTSSLKATRINQGVKSEAGYEQLRNTAKAMTSSSVSQQLTLNGHAMALTLKKQLSAVGQLEQCTISLTNTDLSNTISDIDYYQPISKALVTLLSKQTETPILIPTTITFDITDKAQDPAALLTLIDKTQAITLKNERCYGISNLYNLLLSYGEPVGLTQQCEQGEHLRPKQLASECAFASLSEMIIDKVTLNLANKIHQQLFNQLRTTLANITDLDATEFMLAIAKDQWLDTAEPRTEEAVPLPPMLTSIIQTLTEHRNQTNASVLDLKQQLLTGELKRLLPQIRAGILEGVDHRQAGFDSAHHTFEPDLVPA